jgi:competence protein ComEA
VARLLAPRGWVPPPLDDPYEESPDPAPSVSTAVPEGALGPFPGEAGVWQRLRDSRWDPGGRGAVALAAVALLAVALAVVVVVRGRPSEVPAGVSAALPAPVLASAGTPLPGPGASSATPPAELVVAVAGRVRRPGLVRLPAGSRVDDAVRAAGGVLPGTQLGVLNLARRLVDGEQVLVGVSPPAGAPGPGADPSGAGTSGGGPGGSGSGGGGSGGSGGSVPGAPVDLNAAGVADLDALPGIGPVLAQRIVDWRTAHGRFGSIDQLREVSGIGESTFARLRERVTV